MHLFALILSEQISCKPPRGHLGFKRLLNPPYKALSKFCKEKCTSRPIMTTTILLAHKLEILAKKTAAESSSGYQSSQVIETQGLTATGGYVIGILNSDIKRNSGAYRNFQFRLLRESSNCQRAFSPIERFKLQIGSYRRIYNLINS